MIEVPGLGGHFNFDFPGCEGNGGGVDNGKEKGEKGEEGWAIRDGMMVFKRFAFLNGSVFRLKRLTEPRHFSRETIERLFNKQTNKIIKLIKRQLEHLNESAPTKQVARRPVSQHRIIARPLLMSLGEIVIYRSLRRPWFVHVCPETDLIGIQPT